MDTPYIEESVGADRVCWTIKRPDRLNGIGPTLILQLYKLLKNLQRCRRMQPYSDCVALVIRADPVASKIGPIWCAGGDLKELALLTNSEAKKYSEDASALCRLIESLPMPVIGLLNGQALGGGAEFFLSCDIRLSTTEGILNFKQQEIGLPTGFGGTTRLLNLVGKSKAQWLLLTADKVSAAAGLEMGLIHDVQESTIKCEKKIDALVDRFKQFSRVAISSQKNMLNQNHSGTDASNDNSETAYFMECWGNEIHRAALKRFGK